MAYGKTPDNDGLERRMVDLGRVPVTSELAKLRALCIAATNTIARSVWPNSILDDMPSGKQLDKEMAKVQSAQRGTLNAVWAEKCRLTAKDAVIEQHERAIKCLFGKFKHLDSVGDHPLANGTRRLLNFPEEWSSKLSDTDVAALSDLAKGMNCAGVIELFRKVRLGQVTSLPPLHVQALTAMLDIVEERYGCPEWKTDGSVTQLHLDYRCLPGGRVTQDALLAALNAAIPEFPKTSVETKLSGESRFATTIPLLVSGVVAYGRPLMFRATLLPAVLKGLICDVAQPVRFTSLVLEIDEFKAAVKGVLTQRPKPYALEDATHTVGDDFGYVNTSAMAVMKVGAPLDPEFFITAAKWDKEEARAYLESHVHDGEPVEVELHDGQDFLAAINAHAMHVDALRSEIDHIYNRFHRIKHEVCRIIGVPVDTLLDFGMDAGNNKRLSELLAKLPMLLKQANHLKAIRRGVYRSVDGIKRSWFGWLANRKAKLALKYHAAVIRENLTIVAKEKNKPGYFGRTYNKMSNNGAKGQYLRMASAKLRWFGIPERTVPSYHTSSTDVRFAVVDKRQRKTQDRFVARKDKRVWQADLHAGGVLALYPQLRPLRTTTDVSLTV